MIRLPPPQPDWPREPILQAIVDDDDDAQKLLEALAAEDLSPLLRRVLRLAFEEGRRHGFLAGRASGHRDAGIYGEG